MPKNQEAKKPAARVQDHFVTLTDPRRRKTTVTYPLINIVTIALCAVICGADDFVAIANFGRKKREWLSRFLDLESGIPSHDRFNAILGAIKPAEFEACLLSWITDLHEITAGQVVAIDGKTLRRSYDKASSKSAIHMVRAWATTNQISLGQVVVDEKSNEITAIPKLLEMLEISGCLVTIDAMGCQVKIAETIVKKNANYILAVKDNQPTLAQGIETFFTDHAADNFARLPKGHMRRCVTEEKGHGRSERREHIICKVPDDLPDRARWPKLAAIGMVFSYVLRNGKEHMACRYYILSKYISAKKFAQAVRQHWSIENQLHWQLDVTFQEDQCRVRLGHADANFSILRQTALSLLKNNDGVKLGVKNKRLTAGWDDSYLEQVLFKQ